MSLTEEQVNEIAVIYLTGAKSELYAAVIALCADWHQLRIDLAAEREQREKAERTGTRATEWYTKMLAERDESRATVARLREMLAAQGRVSEKHVARVRELAEKVSHLEHWQAATAIDRDRACQWAIDAQRERDEALAKLHAVRGVLGLDCEYKWVDPPAASLRRAILDAMGEAQAGCANAH